MLTRSDYEAAAANVEARAELKTRLNAALERAERREAIQLEAERIEAERRERLAASAREFEIESLPAPKTLGDAMINEYKRRQIMAPTLPPVDPLSRPRFGGRAAENTRQVASRLDEHIKGKAPVATTSNPSDPPRTLGEAVARAFINRKSDAANPQSKPRGFGSSQ